MISQTRKTLNRLGIGREATRRAIREFPVVRRDFKEFEAQRIESRFSHAFRKGPHYRIYGERTAQAGSASGHYFHQDLLVAREIFAKNPERHVDVGSRVDGFVAHVASFRTVEVLDIRPLHPLPGIHFRQVDLMNLPAEWHEVCDSVSCLHALEHFGMGRYGDPIDYDGWWKGLQALAGMLCKGGTLYLGLPTSEDQRVEFNAHRVFSLPFLHEQLSAQFSVLRCAFVDDSGELHEDIDLGSEEAKHSFFARYGCSIWILEKR